MDLETTATQAPQAADDWWGEPIYTYTRAQALEDGAQVAIPEEESAAAGFSVPVYLTRGVWDQYVEVPEGVRLQDSMGRLWDILHMAHLAGRTCVGPLCEVVVWVRNDNRRPRQRKLLMEIGAVDMDDARPAITIMLPEDL